MKKIELNYGAIEKLVNSWGFDTHNRHYARTNSWIKPGFSEPDLDSEFPSETRVMMGKPNLLLLSRRAKGAIGIIETTLFDPNLNFAYSQISPQFYNIDNPIQFRNEIPTNIGVYLVPCDEVPYKLS